jgi:hypothetical protein
VPVALWLVVAEDFGNYQRGDQLTDPAVIGTVRAGEYAHLVVLVSDEVVEPPPPPPPPPDFAQLQAAYQELAAENAEQDDLLAAAASLNASQANALALQGQQINDLTVSLNQLRALVESGNPSIPPNLADDKPLAEDDGVVLATDGDKVLVGDIR